MARRAARPAGVNRNGIRIARPDRLRADGACGRKDLYRTRDEAQAYAVYFRTRLGTPEPLRSYRCPGCGSWHLTKQLAA